MNWLVKRFSMALLGWTFIDQLFRPLLPAGQVEGCIVGLIPVAATPCMAMALIWSDLMKGSRITPFPRWR